MTIPSNNSKEWFARADNELLSIENNLRSPVVPWATVTFQAHQAIEKYLKGFLISLGTTPEHTHDLITLLKACPLLVPVLGKFQADLQLLTRVYISSRYPEGVEPGEAEARQSYRVALEIKRLVLQYWRP